MEDTGEESRALTSQESASVSPPQRPAQVKVHFLAVGGAPILKKNKFQVRETMTVAEVLMFLRKTLRVRDGDPLFVYVHSSFAPSLDQDLRCLFEGFQVNDELILQYAVTTSWG